jgi:hypothetical protein
MNVETKKAAASTAAIGNIEQLESYRKGDGQSSPNLKEFLGVLLLRLAAGQAKPSGWRLFEVLLGQYYAIERAGGVL